MAAHMQFKPELELFHLPRYQSQIENSTTREFTPISTIQHGAPVEFIVAPVEGRMPDLSHSALYVRVKLTDQAGADIIDDQHCCPINLSLHSMWSSVEVRLGDTLVSDPNSMYPYRALIETLLSYSPGSIATQKAGALFEKDTAGKHNQVRTFEEGGRVPENAGLVARYASFARSNEVEMLDRLHADIFYPELLMPTGLTIRVRLQPASDQFVLMNAAPNLPAFRLRLLDARFYVPFKAPSVSQLAAIELAMSKQAVRFPIRRVSLKHVTIPANLNSTTQDNIIVGRLPKRLIMAMVNETAMSGTWAENPFNFQHFNANFIQLNVNGDLVPPRPLQPDFLRRRYIREYTALFEALDILNRDRGLAIKYDEFPGGYALFAFDLSADQSPNDNTYDARRTGTVRLDIRFGQPLPNPINILLFGEYPGELMIDKYRNVVTAF